MTDPPHFIDQAGGERPSPSAFIQWKGTDVCFDFNCDCGAYLHFDGYFAYFVQCGVCETVWEMPCYLYPRRADASATPTVRMEPDA
jgi:hypothetical protein